MPDLLLYPSSFRAAILGRCAEPRGFCKPIYGSDKSRAALMAMGNQARNARYFSMAKSTGRISLWKDRTNRRLAAASIFLIRRTVDANNNPIVGQCDQLVSDQDNFHNAVKAVNSSLTASSEAWSLNGAAGTCAANQTVKWADALPYFYAHGNIADTYTFHGYPQSPSSPEAAFFDHQANNQTLSISDIRSQLTTAGVPTTTPIWDAEGGYGTEQGVAISNNTFDKVASG